jgi:hypothetical protein
MTLSAAEGGGNARGRRTAPRRDLPPQALGQSDAVPKIDTEHHGRP